MAGPLWAVAGVVVGLRGLLGSLPGRGVLEGGSTSATVGWAVSGPIVLLRGVVGVGGVGGVVVGWVGIGGRVP